MAEPTASERVSVALVARSLAFEVWFYLSMAVMGLLFLPAAAVSSRAARWAMKAFCAQAMAALALLCGLRCERRGEIPDRPVIVAAKHQSFLDVLMLMRWTPQPLFVMKKSLIWAPILGLYALRIGAIPIDRARGKDAMASIEAALAERPGQLVIYPQGTRVAPGTPVAEAPYRAGAPRLAAGLGRPILPVATNAGAFWGRVSFLRRPGVAVLEILPEIPPGSDPKVLGDRLQTVVEAASDQLRRR